MADKACVNRLQKEYKALLKDPVPSITAHPHPSNILEWHYVIEGAKDTHYNGGIYHGKVQFPSQYPYKPPSILMLTPSGRFATGTRLCLSMSDYHPETWNPMWSVASILTGLMSFMYDEGQVTTGSIATTPNEKQLMAAASLSYNVSKSPLFRKLFPEWVEEHDRRSAALRAEREAQEKEAAERAAAAGGAEGAGAGGGGGVGAAGSAASGVATKGAQAGGGWLSYAVLAVLLAILSVPILTLDLSA